MDEFNCTLCGVVILKHDEASHIQGKKHKLKLQEQHVHDKKTKCGIFVGGKIFKLTL